MVDKLNLILLAGFFLIFIFSFLLSLFKNVTWIQEELERVFVRKYRMDWSIIVFALQSIAVTIGLILFLYILYTILQTIVFK